MPTETGADDTASPTDSPVGEDRVHPAEALMRGVLNQPKQYHKRRTIPLQEGAFIPGKKDATGLSLSRRQSTAHPEFLTPEELKARCRAHRPETSGVVQVVTGQVESLGLNVQPDPISAKPEEGVLANPGHVVLPQMNCVDFATDEGRERIRVWAAQLVDLVVVGNSVLIEPG